MKSVEKKAKLGMGSYQDTNSQDYILKLQRQMRQMEKACHSMRTVAYLYKTIGNPFQIHHYKNSKVMQTILTG